MPSLTVVAMEYFRSSAKNSPWLKLISATVSDSRVSTGHVIEIGHAGHLRQLCLSAFLKTNQPWTWTASREHVPPAAAPLSLAQSCQGHHRRRRTPLEDLASRQF